MAHRFRRELGLVIGWLVFPLVPVILEDFYYQTCNLNLFSSASRRVPIRAIGAGVCGSSCLGRSWVMVSSRARPLTYPTTLGPSCRGLRRLLSRRAVWVAIGPWFGFLFWCRGFFGISAGEPDS